ncbi:MAG: hypothetical protein HKN87_06445 [Saprospiraceae bacterium]|nr:hypothetical protein [Saprospiraceae bacterium]
MKRIITLCAMMLLVASGFSKVIVLSGLTNMHSGNQGDLIQGEILVQNIGDKDERIIIYLNDLNQDCHVEPIYEKPGTHSRSLGLWVELNASEKVLAPKEEFVIKYEVRVPDDKAIFGSYWSMLMVEVADPIKEDQLEYGVAMDSKIRYGIQVIANIGKEVAAEIEFITVALNKDVQGHFVLAVAENRGDFVVTPTVILEMYDDSGKLAFKREVPFKKVYPKSCKSFEVPIEELDKGSYAALLVADYGKDLYGTNLQIDLD